MRKIFYKPSALRIIKKFKPVEKEVFLQVKEEIRQTPEAGGFLSGRLTGLRKWKYRVNGVPHRVVYSYSEDRVDIIVAGKRKDFYEKL